MKPYKTLCERAVCEYVEKKSRFIAAVAPVASEDEARAFVAEIRKQHYDARHNVWAYVLRDGVKRYSDDGEPQGTAGIPVLSVLEQNGLENSVCVVTRYFGGILLGAGGLVRAYTHTASLGVAAAGIAEVLPCSICTVTVAYHLYSVVQTLLRDFNAAVDNSAFSDTVTLTARLLPDSIDSFKAALADATGGQAAFAVTGEGEITVRRDAE